MSTADEILRRLLDPEEGYSALGDHGAGRWTVDKGINLTYEQQDYLDRLLGQERSPAVSTRRFAIVEKTTEGGIGHTVELRDDELDDIISALRNDALEWDNPHNEELAQRIKRDLDVTP